MIGLFADSITCHFFRWPKSADSISGGLKDLNAQGIEPAFDLEKIGARFDARRDVTPNPAV
jgi:hypothetical protein